MMTKEWSSFHGPQNKKLDKSKENIRDVKRKTAKNSPSGYLSGDAFKIKSHQVRKQ